MPVLSIPDVKLVLLSWIDLLTLTRWRLVSKTFIPSGIIEAYSHHAADAGLHIVDNLQHTEAKRFCHFANALWQRIGRPLGAVQDARIAFPGSDEVTEWFSVDVHFLGRPGCQIIMQSGIRERSGMTHARGALVDGDSTSHERSQILDLLEKENPNDELLANGIAVLRAGKWRYLAASGG